MICKWNIIVGDGPQLIGSGPILHVAQQDPTELDSIQIWTQEETTGTRNREVFVYGTGMTPEPDQRHVGSVISAGGRLVWHVYEGHTYVFNPDYPNQVPE